MAHTKCIHTGWIVIAGQRFQVDFETPIGASKETTDLAFLAALNELFPLGHLSLCTA